MEKNLILLRGLPGAGKSSIGKLFNTECHFEADDYFKVYKDTNTGKEIRGTKLGTYKFDLTKLKEAHEYCKKNTEEAMVKQKEKIIVSNTFTIESEFEPYYKLAKRYGYRVYSIIVENRHGNMNEHNVPKETIKKMNDRFDVKLNTTNFK